jgi:hypothetical protein
MIQQRFNVFRNVLSLVKIQQDARFTVEHGISDSPAIQTQNGLTKTAGLHEDNPISLGKGFTRANFFPAEQAKKITSGIGIRKHGIVLPSAEVNVLLKSGLLNPCSIHRQIRTSANDHPAEFPGTLREQRGHLKDTIESFIAIQRSQTADRQNHWLVRGNSQLIPKARSIGLGKSQPEIVPSWANLDDAFRVSAAAERKGARVFADNDNTIRAA